MNRPDAETDADNKKIATTNKCVCECVCEGVCCVCMCV